MKTFNVYQQLLPRDGVARFEPVGDIQADTGSAAIDAAKKWSEFREGQGLGRYPVVEEKRV